MSAKEVWLPCERVVFGPGGCDVFDMQKTWNNINYVLVGREFYAEINEDTRVVRVWSERLAMREGKAPITRTANVLSWTLPGEYYERKETKVA